MRGSIGLAGQSATVDENLTGRENLKMVGKLTHMASADIAPRSHELLEHFALNDAADRVVRTFSGGMRRRLDLAGALMHRPPVLFLDEPTTGLDPQGRIELWGVIEDLTATGVTVLLTTQYLEEADYLADYIVVVDHGHRDRRGHRVRPEEPTRRNRDRGRRSADADDAPVAAEKLAHIGAVGVDGKVLHVSVGHGDGGAAMLDTVRTLDAAKLDPTTLVLREPTLDDVFLELTGHVAEQATENGDEAMSTGRRRRRKSQMTTIATPPDATAALAPKVARPHVDRRRAGHRVAQPREHPAEPAAAGVRHDPTGDLHPELPLRVRRRDQHQQPRRRSRT